MNYINKMNNNDWWCPTCKFVIWGSKPHCYKCNYLRPPKPIFIYWTPGDNDPKWDAQGPYSVLKGGYYGDLLPGEPQGLKYPQCGCKHLMNCPVRHHKEGCHCYTCRGKPHKW